MIVTTTEEFEAIVMLANRVAWGVNEGALDTCIVTSYALAAALTDLGYADARPVRVEAASFPDDHKLDGRILGSSFRRPARTGYWCGHLAVCIGQSWLLDPTLDQSNYANGSQWADAGIAVEPTAAPIPTEFWDLDLPPHKRLLWVRYPAVSTRYVLVPQTRFARPGTVPTSHWRPLANESFAGWSRHNSARSASEKFSAATPHREAGAMIGTPEAAASMADSIIVEGDDALPRTDDPGRAHAPDNWMPDDDAFECCCPVCSSQD
jgi:hypothetical protein